MRSATSAIVIAVVRISMAVVLCCYPLFYRMNELYSRLQYGRVKHVYFVLIAVANIQLLRITDAIKELDHSSVIDRDGVTTSMGCEAGRLFKMLVKKVVLSHRLEHVERLLLDPHTGFDIVHNLMHHTLKRCLCAHWLFGLLLQTADFTQRLVID